MTPKKLSTRDADMGYARQRCKTGAAYLGVADLIAQEDGHEINVCVGNLVLAGIAAGDAICAASIGERYSGTEHAAAADLLERVDRDLGARLRTLVNLKPGAHYGNALLSPGQRDAALRAAQTLVDAARARTT